MYKKTHNFMQAGADKTHALLLQSGDDNLSADERLEMLKAKVITMQKKVIQYKKGTPERTQLGLNIAIINAEINSLKEGKKKRPNLHLVFVEVANRVLSNEQYDAIMDEAKRICDLRNAPAERQAKVKHASELEIAIRKYQSSKGSEQ